MAAKVTVVEFSDYECPYSRRFQDVAREVLDRWPTEVRRVVRQFPLGRHRHAFLAAKGAICAADRGVFWNFHRWAFDNKSDLSLKGMRRVANALGLQESDFLGCIRSKKAANRVMDDIELGRAYGVSGTPTVFVNGKRIKKPAALEAEIESILSKVTRE